jgi:hypothetical protein
MAGADDDARVRAWLEAQGAGNLLRAGEGTFKEIRCFSTTALGRTPDDSGRPFTPKGTLEPLLWLLSTAGVEPAAAGDAQRTRTERLAGEKPLNTSARRPLFAGAINAITPWPLAGDFAAGLAAFVILVLASAPLLQLVGVGSEPTYAVQASEPIAAQPSASPPPSAASSAPPSSPSPSSPPAPAPSPAPENSYATSVYSLTPPDGWIRDRDEKPFPGYVSSQWHVPGHSEVYLKVDYTPGYTGTPGAGARSVRNLYPGRVSDYRELGWGATKINGHTAWRWQFRFEDSDVEKVDWFFSVCSTGVALLGAAPPAEFDQYLATFQQTVQSLRFSCE